MSLQLENLENAVTMQKKTMIALFSLILDYNVAWTCPSQIL